MKNLFKTVIALALVIVMGNAATSCTPDNPMGGGDGTPVFEITGEPVVNNAVSVDVPVNIQNITKIGCYAREIYVNENGEQYFVTGYDSNKQPVLGGLATAPSAAVIFRKGTIKECNGALTTLHLSGNDGLDRNKTFIVYFAAAISDKAYYNNGQVLSVEFTTPEKYADDDVAVIRENYEGMDVYLTFPQEVKARGNRIKWGVTNIAMLEYNGNPPMPELLHSCDWVYPAYLVERDTLFEINHYNAYRRNANGDIGYYIIGNSSIQEVSPDDAAVKEGTAGPIQYYYNFQPGEPLVLLLSEVGYADCDLGNYEEGKNANHKIETCDKKHPTINWGWGKGWYWFPYDMDAYINANRGDGVLPDMGVGGSSSSVDANQYWHEGAWYRKIELRLPGPKKFNGTVDVAFSNLSTKDGEITFTPDNQTYMYLVGIYEHTNEYKQGFVDITRDYLDGDDSLWQWFTTAEMAGYFGIINFYATEGPITIKLSEYFNELQAGKTYHVVVNALGKYQGEDGDYYPDVTAQNFQHKTFTLKEYTMAEPELKVTAVEAYSPWKVKFHIQNPNWQNNPVSKVSFVANYAREFTAYMKANQFTYTDMAMLNAGSPYYMLSDADIEMVNSNAGAEIEFDVRENSEFTAAFIGWNAEGRASNPDSETCPGYATAKSLAVEAAEPLDMTAINALKGDWTATATVNVYSAETGEFTQTTRNWKVTIGDLTSPASLSQDIYDLFAASGVQKEAADAYFADLKAEESRFNASVLGQNRVLCQGWAIDDDRTLSTASPWDLFTMTDYNASSVSYLFQDFGPKWFLQVNEKGQVFVPVNYNRIPTFTSWYNGMAHHFCMANYEQKYAFAMGNDANSVEEVGMPVEISADGNTFTIKSTYVQFYNVDENGKPITDAQGNIIYTDVPFYPNVIYEGTSGTTFYNSHVVSEVVFTRGWNGTEPTPSKASVKSINKVVAPTNVGKISTKRTYGISTLAPQQKKAEAKVVKAKQITPEETRKGMEKLMKKLAPARK